MGKSKRNILVCVSVSALCLTAVLPALASKSDPDASARLMVGLLHRWPFAGDTNDIAGHLNAKAQGPVSYTEVGDGMGIVFDGKATGISLPSAPDMQFKGSLTISVWANLYARPSAGQMWSSIIFNGDDRPGLDPFALQADPKGNISFLLTGLNNAVTIEAPMPLRTYVFLTATYDKASGTQNLYEDGKLVNQSVGNTTLTPVVPLVDNAKPGIGIGTNNSFPTSIYNYGWKGVISDLRIYNRALAPAEVVALYHQGVTIPKTQAKVINPTR